ncbi:MAG: FG-GAP repeat domain-containing protein [Planctomycetota bacterium]
MLAHHPRSYVFAFFVILPIVGCRDGTGPIHKAGFQPAVFQNIVFDARRDIKIGSAATHITNADFDADGRVDLLVSRYQESKLTFVRNLGSNNFAAGVDLPAGSLFPLTSSAGDMDNDGLPDVAVTDFLNNQIFIYKNLGGGVFSSRGFMSTATGPVSIAIVDFNQDGERDIAVSGLFSQEIRVHRALGSLTFDAGLSVSVAGAPLEIRSVDADGDLREDIVYTDLSLGKLMLLRNIVNNSNSMNAEFIELAMANTAPAVFGVAVGDLDGDTKPEYVTTSAAFGEVTVWKLVGTDLQPIFNRPGTFPSGGVTIGDFDGDGKRDVATACFDENIIEVWRGNGDGTFTSPIFRSTGIGPVFLTSAELSGDAFDDIAVGAALSGEVSIYNGRNAAEIINGPGGVFVAGQPLLIATGDLDGDAKPDLVVSDNFSDELHVYLNQNLLNFERRSTLHTGAAGTFLPLLFDVDGDDAVDIVSLHKSGATVFRNLGGGLYNNISNFTNAGGYVLGDAGDINRDGLLEFVASGPETNSVGIFSNSGNNVVLDTTIPSGTTPLGVELVDLDRDGDLDLATACAGDATVRISRKKNNGYETNSLTLATNPGPAYIKSGDFGGNSLVDLVVSHTGSDDIVKFRNRGGFRFDEAFILATNGQPVGLAVDDLNKDGRNDLLFTESSTGKGVARLAQVDQSFGPPATTFAAQYNITSAILADLDGDDRLELVTAGSLSGFVVIHKNVSN